MEKRYGIFDTAEFNKNLDLAIEQSVDAIAARFSRNGATLDSEEKGRVTDLLREIAGLVHEKPDTDAGSISATVHSDDYHIDFEFNAAPWFSQASDDEIVALAKIDWGGDYEADDVAQFFKKSTTKKLFDYLATSPTMGKDETVGFECHIDADEAYRWLRENRPEVTKAIDLLT